MNIPRTPQSKSSEELWKDFLILIGFKKESLLKEVEIGFAIITNVFQRELIPIKREGSFLNETFDELGIEYDDDSVRKALERLGESQIIKDGKLNLCDENIESKLTWLLWSSVLKGNMKRAIKDERVFYSSNVDENNQNNFSNRDSDSSKEIV